MSEQKRRANRRNAQLSTGPTSAQGRQRSSQNALQHGILSRKLLLSTEDPAEFEALLQQLLLELAPQGLLEQALVERIAVAMWRQRRLLAAESATISLQQQELSYARRQKLLHMADLQPSDMEWLEVIERYTPDLQATQQVYEQLRGMPEGTDLPRIQKHFHQVWLELISEFEVPEDASAGQQLAGLADAMADAGQTLAVWLLQQRRYFSKLLRLLQALQQVRQACAVPDMSDVLVRYQSALDNDVYKAVRALRETQKHRLDQSALNAVAIETK